MQHRRARARVALGLVLGVAGLGNTHCSPPPVAPSGLTYATKTAQYTVGTAIAPNTPTSTGGQIASYAVVPALPPGLSLDPKTGIISGTPASFSATANYVVTGTNASGSTSANLTITVNDAPPSNLTYADNPAVYTLETPIQPNRPRNSGGKVVSYTGSLPAGLNLDPTTGVITGAPSTASGAVSYTVIALNSGGSTTATVTITVNQLAPAGLSYATGVSVYTNGTAIPANPPSSTGGYVGAYTVTPPLPAGLTVDPGTGVISGTPTAVVPKATYTIKASNFIGSTTATVTITVIDVAPSNLTYSSNPAVYTKFSPVPPNMPHNSGGTIVSYTAVTPLPTGLNLDPTTGVITGTPVAIQAAASYTITGTNTGGSTQVSISIAVNDLPPSNLTYASNPATYTKGVAILPNVPSNSGGVIASYTVSKPLPPGLTLDPAFGVITGTPTAITPTASYTITGTNISGTTQVTLTITVNDAPPSGLTYSSNPAVYTKGVAITPNTPSNTGGVVLTYAVSPALPAGLSFSTATGVITGTPTAITATAVYTVTASNTGGSTTVGLTLTVNDVPPSALKYSTNPAVYTKGTAITPNTPTSSGGPVTAYSVSPALPAGLTLSPTTGIITGTPTAVTATAVYTVTASNTGGSTTVGLTLTVNDIAPSGLTYSTNPATYVKGTAITPNTPSNTGGVVTAYSVLPALPAGLTLSPTTGVISGTPTAVTATAVYTVTASNSGGSTTVGLTITVNDAAPAGLKYSTNPATYVKGTAIAANTPSSTGGAITAYSVLPALPAGLSLSPTTGVISGTPTAVTATAVYTVTGSNVTGSTTVGVTITVNDAAPAGLTYSTNPATYVKGTAIAANNPSSTGGAITAYSVLPALPAGLSLSPTTGVISGTPTAVTATAVYTVTGSNVTGSTTVGVTITVNDAAPAGLTYSTNPATYVKGTAIAANNPSSTGGAITAYSVLPALPAGLSLSPTTGVISGTPTAVTATAVYTVTGSNVTGSTTVGVTITVNDAAPAGLTYSTNPATYVKGTAIAANTPSSTGGAITAYSVLPALPAGLSLSPTTGVISGTPTAVTATAVYTVTGSNVTGSTTVGVTITVNDAAPAGLTYSTNPATYVKGTAIAANNPSSTGGAITAYSVLPALPAGLAISPTTGVISGTPTAVTATAVYTVTGSNVTGSTTVGVTITVNDAAPAGLTYSTNPATYVKGTAIAANNPSSTGGAITAYSVLPALPAGLSLSPTTGIITGTPTVVAATAVYTVTGSNVTGSTTVGVTITVNDVAPSALTYPANPAVYTKGTAITPNTPTNAGGVITGYSVLPALPAGLSLSPTTGIITGTPTAVVATAVYTVTGSNSGGSTTVGVTITVNDVPPAGLTYATNPASYVLAIAITPNTPSSTGGAVTAYSVLPALPAGLGLDPVTGIISGTPTAVTAMATYTVTASNSGGSTTVGVTITVTATAMASLSNSARPTAFALVANGGDGTLSLYTVNAKSGPLRANGYLALGTNPRAVAVDPSGTYAYVTSGNDVLAFSIQASTGGLTSVGAVAAGSQPSDVTVDPSGHFVYVTNALDNTVLAFARNQGTGVLTSAGAAAATGAGPTAISVDPSSRFAYVANSGDNTLSAFTINVASGALSAVGSPVATGTGPAAVSVDPSGSFVYVANGTSGSVSAFTIHPSSGALTAVGAAVAAGAGPSALGIDPSGRFAYVANSLDNTVSAFTINVVTGALTAVGAPVATGTGPAAVSVDPSGSLVYVANATSASVSVYGLNASSGALSPLQTISARAGATAVALVQRATAVRYVPRFAYVANYGGNTLSAFTIDASTGVLTSVGGPVASGVGPASVSVDPTGRFAYVANYGDNTVSAFVINPGSGALSTIGSAVVTGRSPASVCVEPSGSFLYVANSVDNSLSAYAINPGSGTLTAVGAPVATGTGPSAVTVDPSGRFAYVTNAAAGTLSGYAINPTTGALSPVGPDVATGTQPASVTVDPWGGFVYVANYGATDVQAYAINPTTGVLTAVGSAVATGTQPASVSVDPWGGFVYVADYGSTDIAAYGTTPGTGTLASLGTVAAGTQPLSASVDPSGAFLYVANYGAASVSVYSLNPSTGTLTAVGAPAAAGLNPYAVIATGALQ